MAALILRRRGRGGKSRRGKREGRGGEGREGRGGEGRKGRRGEGRGGETLYSTSPSNTVNPVISKRQALRADMYYISLTAWS